MRSSRVTVETHEEVVYCARLALVFDMHQIEEKKTELLKLMQHSREGKPGCHRSTDNLVIWLYPWIIVKIADRREGHH